MALSDTVANNFHNSMERRGLRKESFANVGDPRPLPRQLRPICVGVAIQ